MKTGKNALCDIKDNTFTMYDYNEQDLERDVLFIGEELDVLHCLSHAFSDRVMNKVLPQESVKIIKDYLEGLSKTHPEIMKVLERYQKVSLYEVDNDY